jgi:hypothetical protein
MLKIDFDRLLVWLLPPFLRKIRMVSWLRALITPIYVMYVEFIAFADNANYRLRGTGQVCSMQRVLNDRFDTSLRRISIIDGERYARQFIFTTAENKPIYLGTVFIYDKDDYEDSGVDFTVQVPSDVYVALSNNALNEMKANINFYKLDGKRYKITAI